MALHPTKAHHRFKAFGKHAQKDVGLYASLNLMEDRPLGERALHASTERVLRAREQVTDPPHLLGARDFPPSARATAYRAIREEWRCCYPPKVDKSPHRCARGALRGVDPGERAVNLLRGESPVPRASARRIRCAYSWGHTGVGQCAAPLACSQSDVSSRPAGRRRRPRLRFSETPASVKTRKRSGAIDRLGCDVPLFDV